MLENNQQTLSIDPAIASLRAALDGYIPASGENTPEHVVEAFRRLVLCHLPERVVEILLLPADSAPGNSAAITFLPDYCRYMAFAAEQVGTFIQRFELPNEFNGG